MNNLEIVRVMESKKLKIGGFPVLTPSIAKEIKFPSLLSKICSTRKIQQLVIAVDDLNIIEAFRTDYKIVEIRKVCFIENNKIFEQKALILKLR